MASRLPPSQKSPHEDPGEDLTGVEFDQCLQDFGMHAFARRVRANVFLAENAADANNVGGEFLISVSLGGDESGLTNFEASNEEKPSVRLSAGRR